MEGKGKTKTFVQNKMFITCLLIILVLLAFLSYNNPNKVKYQDPIQNNSEKGFYYYSIPRYLINTTNCKIPDVNPFHKEVASFYHQREYETCSKNPLLSYIEKNDEFITLNINQSLIPLFNSSAIQCCYSTVRRAGNSKTPDNSISISECIPFEKSVVVTDPLIMVKCYNNSSSVQIYSNVHAIISLRHVSPYKISKHWNDANSKLSVLFVGIDSISKQNLIRCMPKTYSFLENKDFVNLKGYTKVGLNTLPNLMGILAGLNMNQVEETCNYNIKIDECPNIWKNFSDLGFITAYGEDASSIGTFNYQKKGFTNPPTDFYFRPYILAAMKLGVIERYDMDYCAGPETEAERTMNLVKDFQFTFKKYPKFGFFFMNTFSHDDLNMPSALDEKVRSFLEDIYHHLDNTVLFFFSDHGFRFGGIRYTYSGWLEERLPYFYVYVPKTFKKKYPEKYEKLLINSNRLTSAYDIYMTLQDILFLSNRNYSTVASKACPKCHSLFQEVSEERSCSDAAIDSNWCVCNMLSPISMKDPITLQSAHFFVNQINQLVKSHKQSDKCSTYQLDNVTYIGTSRVKNKFNQTKTSLLLRVKMEPEANFEGRIELSHNGPEIKMRLISSVSRLDKYAPVTKCIRNADLERYCYCVTNITKLRNRL